MGAIHNALTRGDVSAALTRALGVTRGASGVERLGETLTPVIDVFNRPDWLFLRHEYGGALSTLQLAVAAQVAFIAVVNPAASTLITVVEQATYLSGGVSDLKIFPLPDASLTGVVASVALILTDRRAAAAAGLLATRTLVRRGSNVGSLSANQYETLRASTAGQDFRVNVALPVILPPGQALVIEDTTLANAIQVNWRIRERIAYPGELQP